MATPDPTPSFDALSPRSLTGYYVSKFRAANPDRARDTAWSADAREPRAAPTFPQISQGQ